MKAAPMKKIARYRGNRQAKSVAIINANVACALGKLGSRISPGLMESLEAISKKKRGLSLFTRNLRP
jgi:hypothetical protein